MYCIVHYKYNIGLSGDKGGMSEKFHDFKYKKLG